MNSRPAGIIIFSLFRLLPRILKKTVLKLRKSLVIPTRRRGGEEISISREKEYLQGVPAERDIISRMEMGDRLVTDYVVVTIAEVLDVSVVWLLGKEE